VTFCVSILDLLLNEVQVLEIAQGLDYLHSMNIVHGDLRGANILISDTGNACLSDFGLATTISDADSTAAPTSSANHGGSLRWFAPELMDWSSFGCERFNRTPASDVYAYACVCLEVQFNSIICITAVLTRRGSYIPGARHSPRSEMILR
jgi:serine/threonine protein kinase